MARNGYYVVPLFSANYAGVQNDFGVSGDVMIRRQAFELLAEYGYYDGLVPYLSNQYKESAKSEQTILSDQYILEKISGSTYETMTDFKKAMFQRRIEKINKLKPVTIMWKDQSVTINDFEELRLLMKEAIEHDLIEVNVLPDGSNNIRAQATEVERLKQEIFKAYLMQTEDFRKSIYSTDPTPEQPEKPGDTDTEKPGDTTTEQPETPGDTDTEKPGDTTTEQPETPGDTDTEKPGDTTTEQPETPGDTQNGNSGDKTVTSGNDKQDTTPKLLLCKVSSAKNSHTLRWNSVKSADGYEIYGAKSNGKYKLLQTLSNKSVRWKHKKLKSGTQYKYYVKAYKKVDGKRVILAQSLSVYSITAGGKYGNPSKIGIKKTHVSVKSGRKIQLRINVTGKKISKTGKKVRYVSSNPSIATVSKKGIIIGKKRGSCTIYCIARNGLYKKVKVTINR